jgi:Ras-related protein Rab-8A
MNEGVEEAFFTLARLATGTLAFFFVPSDQLLYRDIKTRLIDSQAENATSGTPANDSVKVNNQPVQPTQGCCS